MGGEGTYYSGDLRKHHGDPGGRKVIYYLLGWCEPFGSRRSEFIMMEVEGDILIKVWI